MWTGLRWVQFRWKASDSENTFFMYTVWVNQTVLARYTALRYRRYRMEYTREGEGTEWGGEEEVLLTPEFFIQASLFVMFLLPFNNEDLLVQQTSTTGQKGQYSHI